MPSNLYWQMDTTGKIEAHGNSHNILGIIDSGSRLCLFMKALSTKSTTNLIRGLCDAIDLYGKPKFIRIDNESNFTSRLLRFVLFVLNIKHQRSDLHCPWQNGRIERLFGTLKQKLIDLIYGKNLTHK